MKNEPTPEESKMLGQQADSLLQNPAFKAAVEALNDEYVAGWAATEAGQIDKREHLYQKKKALGEVVQRLDMLMQAGEFEAANEK